MNIYNHSIWPPPGASNVERLAKNTHWHAALLQQSRYAALINLLDEA